MKNVIQRIHWYINRFASMSGTELRHRISEQIKRALSARALPKAPKLAPEINLPVLPGIASGLFKLAKEESLLREWAEIAQRAKDGRIKLLGIEWPGARDNNRWVIDPITGNHWPQSVYCFRVPYRHNKSYGDIKYVWELNRLQYLQPIAALAALENNEELAQFCASEIESWIDNNPPFKGVNWVSGIELASRVVSIIVVTSLIGEKTFSKTQRHKLLSSLAIHGYWLMRYPSRFSSANNHLIAEAGGLFILGILLPSLPDSDHWAHYGFNTLIAEASNQIYKDGVGAEQSPTYTAFTLEWLLMCGKIGELNGKPFPKSYWQRIELAGEFLRWITDASGNQPRIGDDDEGCIFCSQNTPEYYVSSILGCLSTTLDRDDLAPPVVQPHLREAFFGRTTPYTHGPEGTRCFQIGGYTVNRSIHNGIENLFVFDHGQLGYLSIAAHGHADALAIWLHIDGKPVLVDSGTYLYHSGNDWRDHMRSTPAHNTLSIRGTDSSLITGAFNWSNKANTCLISFAANANECSIEAEHNGFAQRFGAYHRRRVEINNDGSFTIIDSLRGNEGKLPVELGFLFHPDLNIKGQDRLWIVYDSDLPILEIQYHDTIFHGTVQCGLQSPLRGWYSPHFGHKIAAPRLTFEGILPSRTPSKITLRPINTHPL